MEKNTVSPLSHKNVIIFKLMHHSRKNSLARERIPLVFINLLFLLTIITNSTDVVVISSIKKIQSAHQYD